jgi:hypothetical protein
MRLLFTLSFLLLIGFAKANPGDTTWVNIHDKTQMTWYERYAEKALMPNGSKAYHKILMRFTMGCATGGCSDWDYTVRLNILHPTGAIDSTVASIDTISTSPLVIDTTWSVFDVKERMELARVITPYGNGLNNNWTHDFVYDVTDYYSILKDSVEMEIFYQGWSAGFSATVDFAFIEGPRPREVYAINNIYMGKGDYINSANFEQQHLPQKNIDLDPLATGLLLRANFSGHGFVNTLNCAEFCNRNYFVKVGGQTVATQAMWRDDCGLNPIYPQGGTWLTDRANWCPGDKSLFREHDLSTQLTGSTLDLDVDIESYTYTVPPQEVPANYNYAVQLIQHGDLTFTNDVELEKVMAPSTEDEFGRINPICGTAIVKIRNKGSQALTSCKIRYGLKGQAWSAFDWTGNLEPMASAIVELPFGPDQDWWAVAGSNFEFEAIASDPNGQTDQNPLNNSYSSSYEAPDVYPADFKLSIKTNNVGSDTHWSVTALDGTVVASGDNMAANTVSANTLNLSPGCYFLSVKDRSKNGLSYFANNDGSGYVQIKNEGGSFFFENLNANFGTELKKYFTVGYKIGVDEPLGETKNFFSFYPNPASNELYLDFVQQGKHDVSVSLLDATGKPVLTQNWQMEDGMQQRLSIEALSPGIYFVEANVGKTQYRKKLLIL